MVDELYDKWVWSADQKRKVKAYRLNYVTDWRIWEFDKGTYSVWAMLDGSGFTAYISSNKQDCINYIDTMTGGK